MITAIGEKSPLPRTIDQDITVEIFQGAAGSSNLQASDPAVFLNRRDGFALHKFRSAFEGRIKQDLVEAAPHNRPGRIRQQSIGFGTTLLHFHPKWRATGIEDVNAILNRVILRRELRLKIRDCG